MKERPLFYVLDGKVPRPTDDVEEAARFLGDLEKRRVAVTDVSKDVRVSTVFLASDHAWSDPPVLFETMIFGGLHDQEQERYHTWDEAEAGHAAWVARTKAEEGV